MHSSNKKALQIAKVDAIILCVTVLKRQTSLFPNRCCLEKSTFVFNMYLHRGRPKVMFWGAWAAGYCLESKISGFFKGVHSTLKMLYVLYKFKVSMFLNMNIIKNPKSQTTFK